MRALIETGRELLMGGRSALYVVTWTVVALERSGYYIAGRGASPNLAGEYELDACIMDGAGQQAGAVAALQGYVNPVLVAREVMLRTPHVLLAGGGAAQFAQGQGFDRFKQSEDWYTRACQDENVGAAPAASHGTVGCVALDTQGRLAAASSTGGMFGKLPGRCGDTAVVGAGTWADRFVAVSCTGQGEYFLRVAAAVQVAHRVRWAGESLDTAALATIEDVRALGGSGGLIAIDRQANVAMPFSSSGMKRAALLADGTIVAEAF